MPIATSKPFNQRAFVALVAAVAGLGLPLTGLFTHLLGTEAISPRRHFWMAAHNGLGILFATFVVWHLVLNRRALLAHIRGVSGPSRSVRREILWATAVVAAVLLVAAGHTFHAQ
jgi:hypothetical protein